MVERRRLIGVYVVFAAAASFVLAPLLAIAYFATSEGAKYLEQGTVSAWAEPGRDAVGGLVTFASAETVYSTYVIVLALLMPAIPLCAGVTRRLRPDHASAAERWGWRLALPGYVLLVLGLLLVGVLLLVAGAEATVVNVAFVALVLPGLLLSVIGSTVLGIALLRAGYRPRLTPWLLALAIPLWILGSVVLGHNGLGLVPLLVAWAATGWRLWRGNGAAAPAGQPSAG